MFDRLGGESPPLTVTLPEKKKTEVKTLKPLKTSVTVQLKVRIALTQRFFAACFYFSLRSCSRALRNVVFKLTLPGHAMKTA